MLIYNLQKYTHFDFLSKYRASPGIEPGPPVPETGILPLNYGAISEERPEEYKINSEEEE